MADAQRRQCGGNHARPGSSEHEHARRHRVDQLRPSHAQHCQQHLCAYQHGARRGRDLERLQPRSDAADAAHRDADPQKAQRHARVDQATSVVLESRRRHSQHGDGLQVRNVCCPQGPAACVPLRRRFPGSVCTRCAGARRTRSGNRHASRRRLVSGNVQAARAALSRMPSAKRSSSASGRSCPMPGTMSACAPAMRRTRSWPQPTGTNGSAWP